MVWINLKHDQQKAIAPPFHLNASASWKRNQLVLLLTSITSLLIILKVIFELYIFESKVLSHWSRFVKFRTSDHLVLGCQRFMMLRQLMMWHQYVFNPTYFNWFFLFKFVLCLFESKNLKIYVLNKWTAGYIVFFYSSLIFCLHSMKLIKFCTRRSWVRFLRPSHILINLCFNFSNLTLNVGLLMWWFNTNDDFTFGAGLLMSSFNTNDDFMKTMIHKTWIA
jgi:hypothetical protein